MKKLNLYSFHRGIANHRFDAQNTAHLLEELSKNYDVKWFDLNGDDKFVYKNGCEVLINQGSILIFEFDDTKKFKTFDFGDAPTTTIKLAESENFVGAAIGQYNKVLWDFLIKNEEVRKKIKPSVYPESCWNLGIENWEQIQSYRKSTKLDKRLYWRGSVYKEMENQNYRNTRLSIDLLNKKMNDFYFGNLPINFESYISEAMDFKLALCFGGGGGWSCGDFCFRDIEMYGLGIPTIRPRYAVESDDPLLPNVHYISVDCEFDSTFKYQTQDVLADKIIERYNEVIDNDEFLDYIRDNARSWYIRNASGPNITYKIIDILEL